MKSLREFINEKKTDEYGREILTKDEITLEEIENAIYAASFSKDRATIYADDEQYDKIGKNKWQHLSKLQHVLSGTISDKQMFDIVKGAKEAKMYLK